MISSLCSVDIQASWEQAPSFDNRIELSQKKDRFGVPLVNLYWNIFPIDFRTIRLSVLEFGRYLLDTDLGRIKIFEEILGTSSLPDASILAGFHHMGGTRMSSDPVKGVVDRNCRVHGQTNLYVIGSSVFSSGGHANPTLTIVQLSLRLSNYLKSVV
jgi:choline dehydrogenase-like flavoprotein